jgi:hypothetical protein
MSDLDWKARSESETAATTTEAVQKSAGKRTLVETRYGVQRKKNVQMKGGESSEAVHATADAGLSGGGGSLPFADQIQRSFGAHDVGDIRAHTGGAAAEANAALGSQAYAKGTDVAFAGTPDLHTAAHEAAHVVQQRAGVSLKGGVGEAGDAYEQHADAVADKVVAGESAEGLLDQMAGTPAGGAEGAVQSRSMQMKPALQFLGTPLDQDLPPGQEAPRFGESKGEQRRWSPEQYIKMWEDEQGRKMTPEEKETIDRGCIGITANNLNGGGNPLDMAEKIYGTFEQAHEAMVQRNKTLNWMKSIPLLGSFVDKSRYVLFAKLFWSNQSAKWEDRLKADDKAFLPDPKTGEVDMSGYNYEPQSRWKKDPKTGAMKKSSYVNFDYGFWDDASSCFWHANHMEYRDDPQRMKDDPMIVLQSTKDKFTAGYFDFDRIVFCIARAENYDPGLAAISHARGGG